MKTPNIHNRQLVVIMRADFFLLVGSNINCECSISKALAKELSSHCNKCINKFAWNYIISNWIKLNANPTIY